jgi:hypothetical protein
MRFRHSRVSFVVSLLGTLAAASCATSGADNEHGPDFLDAGGGGDASGEVEVTGDAAQDVTAADSPAESAPSEDGDTTGDAPLEVSGTQDAGATETGTGCTSSMALLAASGSSVAQASFVHGAWASATVVSGGASAAPTLVPFGTGYLGSFVGAGAVGDMPLESTAYTGSWSHPAQIGAALGQGVPALAVAGADAHVVYWGSDGKFYHGTSTGSWDAASDPVQASGVPQSFGPSAPAAAAVGSTLVMVQSGQDGVLYDQTWTGSWQPASAHAGSSVVSALSPAVVALNGGTPDLMIAFVHAGDAGNYYLQYTTRTGGTWSSPADVYDQSGNVAYSGTTPALAALPGGKAVLAWQGSAPAYPYVSTYDPASGWTAPVAASSDTIVSPPSAAPGVCGATSALAYVKTDGTLALVSMVAGVWSAPQAIPGATGMTWTALASSP